MYLVGLPGVEQVVVLQRVPLGVVFAVDLVEFLSPQAPRRVVDVVLSHRHLGESDRVGGPPAVFPVRDEAVGVRDDRPAEPAVLTHPVFEQAKLLVGHFVRIVPVRFERVGGDGPLERRLRQVGQVVGHTLA